MSESRGAVYQPSPVVEGPSVDQIADLQAPVYLPDPTVCAALSVLARRVRDLDVEVVRLRAQEDRA